MHIVFMLRKSVYVGIAALFMGASLVFTFDASAHDIDAEQARQKLKGYAQTVDKDGNPDIRCDKIYPHQVICEIRYFNPVSLKISCEESITVYFKSHSGSKRDWTYYTSHRGPKKCGKKYLSGPNP